jgi:hypothetical protein
MNIDHAMELLIEIATRDQRTIGRTDAEAWANDLSDVTLDEALEAATAFHRSEAARERRIKAADIVVWVRWSRRQVVEQEHRENELERARVAKMAAWGEPQEPARALPVGGIVGSDPTGGRGESASLRELWEETLPAHCPPKPKGCGSLPGQRCLNPHTGLATKIPHPARMRAAQVSG